MSVSAERETIAKVTWRLIPFLFFCYIIAYIDRINVGFAGLQLQKAFGLDASRYYAVYGWGAGLFFVGYFLFEVPSNLVLHKVGARIWITRIMIVWGVISSAMMFVRTPTAFYVMRFLLGAAEAGFFPGIILYLTYWYRVQDRARTMALFSTASALAGVVSSPISGVLLHLDGSLGLAGWQWLFLIEGMPAVIVGACVFFILPDRPERARWLTAQQKEWIRRELEQEQVRLGLRQESRLRDVFTSRRIWVFCLLYLLLNIAGYGFEMWLPQILKGLSGLSDFQVGFLNAIPYLAATVAMVLIGQHSDRARERRRHVAAAAFAAAVGFFASALAGNVVLALAALILAFAGLKSIMGPFWAFSTAALAGRAAAGGIAWINSIGNLGGFIGPAVVGHARTVTGSYSMALLFLSAALVLLGFLALSMREK